MTRWGHAWVTAVKSYGISRLLEHHSSPLNIEWLQCTIQYSFSYFVHSVTLASTAGRLFCFVVCAPGQPPCATVEVRIELCRTPNSYVGANALYSEYCIRYCGVQSV